MIKKLYAQNFKSWKELKDFNLGHITLLFGENSSGKTSIIQLLLLLKQTVESFDRAQPLNMGSRETLVELGMYEDIIHGHDESRNLHLLLEWDFQDKKDHHLANASLDVEFQYKANTIRVKNTKLALDEEWATLVRNDKGAYGLIKNGLPVSDLGKSKELAPIKCYGFPSLATQHDPTLHDLSLSVEALATSIFYLGPVRSSPSREYAWSGSAPAGVGTHGETAIQAALANLMERAALKKTEREKVPDLVESAEKWLKRLGLADTFKIEGIRGTRHYRVILEVPDYGHHANVTDVGVGVSQVLPVVILSHFAPEGSIIVLEQPELHLHPSVQSKLADMFYELSLERNLQFIIETHSEHLLTRFQRRVAEREMEEHDPDLRLYVCKRETGESLLEPLQLDESGQIMNWPPHFFGDTVSDKEVIMRAYFNKKLQRQQMENPKND